MHLNNKILIINFYFSKVDKQLTEWVGLKINQSPTKPMTILKLKIKFCSILGFFSEKYYLQYETV